MAVRRAIVSARVAGGGTCVAVHRGANPFPAGMAAGARASVDGPASATAVGVLAAQLRWLRRSHRHNATPPAHTASTSTTTAADATGVAGVGESTTGRAWGVPPGTIVGTDALLELCMSAHTVDGAASSNGARACAQRHIINKVVCVLLEAVDFPACFACSSTTVAEYCLQLRRVHTKEGAAPAGHMPAPHAIEAPSLLGTCHGRAAATASLATEQAMLRELGVAQAMAQASPSTSAAPWLRVCPHARALVADAVRVACDASTRAASTSMCALLLRHRYPAWNFTCVAVFEPARGAAVLLETAGLPGLPRHCTLRAPHTRHFTSGGAAGATGGDGTGGDGAASTTGTGSHGGARGGSVLLHVPWCGHEFGARLTFRPAGLAAELMTRSLAQRVHGCRRGEGQAPTRHPSVPLATFGRWNANGLRTPAGASIGLHDAVIISQEVAGPTLRAVLEAEDGGGARARDVLDATVSQRPVKPRE